MSRANPRYRRINPLGLAVGAGGVVEYICQGSIEGQMTINTFYYYAPVAAPSPTQLVNLETAISTIMFPRIAACVSSDWTCVRELLNVVHRNDLLGVVNVFNAGNAGTRPATHLPTEVAAVVLKKTLLKGQHGRGRISLPAINPADVTASTITNAVLKTNLTNLCTAMLTANSDGTNNWTPCVATRSTVTPKLVTNYSLLTVAVPDYVLGTVRRRKLGRGK